LIPDVLPTFNRTVAPFAPTSWVAPGFMFTTTVKELAKPDDGDTLLTVGEPPLTPTVVVEKFPTATPVTGSLNVTV
jgi:hypothetical protein